jgi:diguanylate cyclase (GGDEF)-like protein
MTDSRTDGAPRGVYLAFLILLGLGGWAVLLAATYVPDFGPPPVPHPSGMPALALFVLIIVAARSLAFRLGPGTLVSLDSAFYVAAAVCLGSVTSGRLVALALTLDALLRLFGPERGRRSSDSGSSVGESLAYVLYFGGMTGALIMACGWLFGVDRLALTGGAAQLTVLGVVVGVGLTLLCAHYAIQGARLWLRGERMGRYLRRMALPGVLAEATLLPLAVVVVLIYHPDRPLGFALLGATYLLINFGFNRLSRASAQLRRRVGELEILNATARQLAASLQLSELVEAIARGTIEAVPEAEILTLTHRASGRAADELVVDCYDREADTFERLRAEVGEGLAGRVMTEQQSLRIDDLRQSELGTGAAADSGMRAWLGVPIVLYGGVEGALAVQSRTPGAFGEEQQRLLESIAAQVAIALQNAHLYELAMVDGLTGLFVRRYFDARLDEEIERARRYGTEFSVAMMDIDNFKELNDTHGHQAGDRVLRDLAAIIRQQMRGGDTAARYGGEEFSMILPRTDMVAAYNQAERIRALIADYRLSVGDQVVSVTASFGIAAYPGSGATTAEDLVRLADRALYRAKRTGKDRVELYWSDSQPDGRSSIRSV